MSREEARCPSGFKRRRAGSMSPGALFGCGQLEAEVLEPRNPASKAASEMFAKYCCHPGQESPHLQRFPSLPFRL